MLSAKKSKNVHVAYKFKSLLHEKYLMGEMGERERTHTFLGKYVTVADRLQSTFWNRADFLLF